uniref:Ribosomal protein S10 n=1 Tax=Hucho hucho TaxID=62062 RepID=A0A4W5NE20_9TELE
MLMPKKNRIAIYELLFKEGVMVAKKDVHLAKHPELADKNVPNLHVMKAMQSLKSTGYVKEQFAWRHFYWYLTNEGIQYLRDFLHLPPEIVPATLRRQMRPETARPRPKGMEGERVERPARFNREGGDRDNYRRSVAPREYPNHLLCSISMHQYLPWWLTYVATHGKLNESYPILYLSDDRPFSWCRQEG